MGVHSGQRMCHPSPGCVRRATWAAATLGRRRQLHGLNLTNLTDLLGLCVLSIGVGVMGTRGHSDVTRSLATVFFVAHLYVVVTQPVFYESGGNIAFGHDQSSGAAIGAFYSSREWQQISASLVVRRRATALDVYIGYPTQNSAG